ncbi:MAG: hypothetical protein HY774_23990 [Acidobacteria bacterium]|nr:hypothetical protein [Acidobacteriota bacterium]
MSFSYFDCPHCHQAGVHWFQKYRSADYGNEVGLATCRQCQRKSYTPGRNIPLSFGYLGTFLGLGIYLLIPGTQSLRATIAVSIMMASVVVCAYFQLKKPLVKKETAPRKKEQKRHR